MKRKQGAAQQAQGSPEGGDSTTRAPHLWVPPSGFRRHLRRAARMDLGWENKWGSTAPLTHDWDDGQAAPKSSWGCAAEAVSRSLGAAPVRRGQGAGRRSRQNLPSGKSPQPDPSSFLAALPALGLSSGRLPGDTQGCRTLSRVCGILSVAGS